jgi:hypothetical protein
MFPQSPPSEDWLTTALIWLSREGLILNTSPFTWQGVARRALERADDDAG